MVALDIYHGRNPIELPLYSYAEAARYLKLPVTTVRYWARGGPVTTPDRRIRFQAVIEPTADSGLSFQDLIELFVLKALRRIHRVDLGKIRTALDYASRELKVDHLLLRDLTAFGGDVFIRRYGELIAVTKYGQVAIEEFLNRYLTRVERRNDMPVRLFPFFEEARTETPVDIDPTVAFGRPTVHDTGIRTEIIAARVAAGESPEFVAEDFNLELDYVKDALFYEIAA